MTNETTPVGRQELALQLSEEILTGIETETLTTSSAALRCLRLARLIFDDNATEWLQYETKGYPSSFSGLEPKAKQIAQEHGRESINKDNQEHIFVEIADELEAKVQAAQSAMGILTTKGVSIAGDTALLAINSLTRAVSQKSNIWYGTMTESQRNLAILRGQYYAYALAANLELKFSKQAEEVFRSYRLSVDKQLIALAPESLKRLEAAYERLSSTNPESWSQAVTSCRRVFEEISNSLYSGSLDNPYLTQSGKTLDVSGNHYQNRLYATIDMVATSRNARRLVGSNVMYVIDFIDNLHNSLCRGVHDLEDQLTYNEARASILHTYLLLGDISILVRDSKGCQHEAVNGNLKILS
ncbi:MAG: hypothetical protein WAW52_00850 [Methanothrix sp.]